MQSNGILIVIDFREQGKLSHIKNESFAWSFFISAIQFHNLDPHLVEEHAIFQVQVIYCPRLNFMNTIRNSWNTEVELLKE